MKTTYEIEKQRLIAHLKASGKFTDFNYSGSNINAILDTLSLNTSNISHIVSMLVSESAPQTAKLKESLIVHALKNGFLVRRVGASTATVNVTVDVGNSTVSSVVLYAGTQFTGVTPDGDSVQFTSLSDQTLERVSGVAGQYSGNVTISQGSYTEASVQYDATTSDVVKFASTYCDVDTLSVSVQNPAGFVIPYVVYDGKYSPLGTDAIAYVSLGTDMYYSIAFGKDKFGLQPENTSIVKYRYLKTNGVSGNNCGQFTITPGSNPVAVNDARNFTVSVETLSNSAGGFSEIDIDSLKSVLTYYSRSGGIALTPTDIKNKILYIYRNVESIYVEGGQRDILHGKVIVSIKPKNSDTLSVGDKLYITNQLESKYMLNSDVVVFVDPDYINLKLSIEYVPSVTNTLYTKENNRLYIAGQVAQFSRDVLSKFDSSYSDVALLNYLNRNNVQYNDIYVNKTLSYTLKTTPSKTLYVFTVNVRTGDFVTDNFTVGEVTGYSYKSRDGKVILYNNNAEISTVGTLDYNTGSVMLDAAALNLNSANIVFNFNTQRSVIASNKHIIRISSVEVV